MKEHSSTRFIEPLQQNAHIVRLLSHLFVGATLRGCHRNKISKRCGNLEREADKQRNCDTTRSASRRGKCPSTANSTFRLSNAAESMGKERWANDSTPPAAGRSSCADTRRCAGTHKAKSTRKSFPIETVLLFVLPEETVVHIS